VSDNAGSGAPRLLLFDIDGTLLTSRGAGERALTAAVRDQFGSEDALRGVEIAGRTDSGIARQILRALGQDVTAENITRLFDSYLQHLPRFLPLTGGSLLPGVRLLLERLHGQDDAVLALLTGNLARGAELKLIHFGVWEFFRFGAYADDHHDRNELGPFAVRRAFEHKGFKIAAEHTFVIGDTPHDIACGRAFGAKTVAVATGIYSREQLAPHEPDFLFDDLRDTAAVLAAFGFAR
jgi:phosphoglycolate phosphatase